ncbi:response regulator [bacterium]|nr:response regulator [bacterium]
MVPKARLLFIDDEEPIRDLFIRAMSDKKNFLVQTAVDGEDALNKLKTFPANIVVSDILMPHMDGLTLLKEIKTFYPDILVLLVTGFGTIQDAVDAMRFGAYDYILKPIDFVSLHKKIEKIIDDEFNNEPEPALIH